MSLPKGNFAHIQQPLKTTYDLSNSLRDSNLHFTPPQNSALKSDHKRSFSQGPHGKSENPNKKDNLLLSNNQS